MTDLDPIATYNLVEAIRLSEAANIANRVSFVANQNAWQHIKRAHEAAKSEDPLGKEPIRTVHHFSCTGGTLISKCIASMANVLILNEIDLHSDLPFLDKPNPAFTPTDIVALLRQGAARIDDRLISKLLISNLEIIREEQWRRGKSVVLRDHSHSFFLTGADLPKRPTLLEMVATHFCVRSIITVRNPIDSWLSMEQRNWHEMFSPPTFEEYCRRYLIFLNKHNSVPLVRYEDFVTAPKQVMKRICELLELEYFEGFEGVFSAHKLSGDSGRSRPTISHVPRRANATRMEAKFKNNKAYKELTDMIARRSEK